MGEFKFQLSTEGVLALFINNKIHIDRLLVFNGNLTSVFAGKFIAYHLIRRF